MGTRLSRELGKLRGNCCLHFKPDFDLASTPILHLDMQNSQPGFDDPRRFATMPGSYVPPHLRNKAVDSTQQEKISAGLKTGPPTDLFTLREIHDYFWECDHAK